jgi:hypothetical protein
MEETRIIWAGIGYETPDGRKFDKTTKQFRVPTDKVAAIGGALEKVLEQFGIDAEVDEDSA